MHGWQLDAYACGTRVCARDFLRLPGCVLWPQDVATEGVSGGSGVLKGVEGGGGRRGGEPFDSGKRTSSQANNCNRKGFARFKPRRFRFDRMSHSLVSLVLLFMMSWEHG